MCTTNVNSDESWGNYEKKEDEKETWSDGGIDWK